MMDMYKDPFNTEDFTIQDSYVTFNIGRFIRFFMYHFIFFFVSGPATVLFMKPFENMFFIRNMGFWGWTTSMVF